MKIVKQCMSMTIVACLAVASFAACDGADDTGGGAGQNAMDQPATAMTPLFLAAASVALPPTGLTPLDLPNPETAGATHLVKYCTVCHALPTPGAHSATDWPSVVRRMWLRTDRVDPSFNVPIPQAGERVVLLNYLVENALQVTRGNLLDAPGRDLFVSTCSQCHELAAPQQHSPDDWPAVVTRMMGHMDQMLGSYLDPQSLQTIVSYLEAASAM